MTTTHRRCTAGLVVFLTLTLLMVPANRWAAGAPPITLVVDGQTVACDVPPQLIGGRVLVPIRAVSEALRCTVAWDAETRRVTVSTGSQGASGSSGLTLVDASKLYVAATGSVAAILNYQFVNGREAVVGWGSGFVFSADGCLVTNAHVVDGAARLKVLFPDGRAYDVGTQILSDKMSDVAVIRLGVSGLVPLTLGDSDKVAVGEPVIAIGNPASMRLRNTVTAGVVSGIGRTLETDYYPLIQTDAAINPGNSGGPLLNARGEVIGMPSSKFVAEELEGLAFAIPINVVKQVVAELLTKGRVVRPWLGLTVQSSPEAEFGLPTEEGLTVVYVDPRGPAQAAGIQTGDEIVAIDGTPTHSVHDLMSVLMARKPGDPVRLTVVRGATTLNVTVVLAERPADLDG
ncbi:MAG: trypsin-like peptidase domain-containing protein [Firmicutes bacterium]|nr:trypsin-like peptidase domain-containing protein [Bacillota bacterium]